MAHPLQRRNRRNTSILAQPSGSRLGRGQRHDEPGVNVSQAALSLVPQSIKSLHLNEANPRAHSQAQIKALARSIREFGFTAPVLVDETNRVLAGHGRLEAARLLGLECVPTLTITGLSEAKKLAYAIADNRIAELAGWDRALLAAEVEAILELDAEVDLTITGFATAEIDLLIQGDEENPARSEDADDTVALPEPSDRAVTRLGDLWSLGEHRLLCGDATDAAALDRLMAGEPARLVITDPPYNVRIDGHVTGKGKRRHRAFAMASGEMTPEAFQAFLARSLGAAVAHSLDGALAFVFMDWRHLAELQAAARALGLDQLNLVVWSKTNAGMGSLYRSQHELIAVVKSGTALHVNNVALGRYGRNRTNVWTYPGANTFRRGRLEDLEAHPTVKPIALIADAIQDASNRGDTVLDPFVGSGTTILAVERMGRRCRAVEIDPLYCDVAIRRWQERTSKAAILEPSGQTFDALAAERDRDPTFNSGDPGPAVGTPTPGISPIWPSARPRHPTRRAS